MPFQTTNGKLFYRVGDVIITTNSENPSKWYGGTWELFAPGRTIVCIDTSQTEFNTIKKTGGNKNMQQHTHGGSVGSGGSHAHSASSASAGAHTHTYTAIKNAAAKKDTGNGTSYGDHTVSTGAAGSHSHTITVNSGGSHNHTLTINNAGSGNAQNLQPYIVVYMWIRIA